MRPFVILLALLAIAAIVIVIVGKRRQRAQSRQGSRYFSINLASPTAPGISDDQPH